jgi:hypothetical protein
LIPFEKASLKRNPLRLTLEKNTPEKYSPSPYPKKIISEKGTFLDTLQKNISEKETPFARSQENGSEKDSRVEDDSDPYHEWLRR